MVSSKFCYQETFCVFIYGERVYIDIYSVMQMYFMQIYFYLLGFGNKLIDFFVFPNFLLTLYMNYKGK